MRIVDDIPVSGKVFGNEELLSAISAVLDGWWTEGKVTKEFIDVLSKYLNVRHGLFCNSGSSANLLALTALLENAPPNSEVITCATGFPTTVNPIIQNKAVPVFIDSEIGTYNIDVGQIEEHITSKTVGIALAHTLGNPFDVSGILKLCSKYDLWLLEDTCDALSSKYARKRVGCFGDISTFSFYPAHFITTGEGGATFTNNPSLFRTMRSYRDWGRGCWCLPGHDNTCGKRFSQEYEELPEGFDHKYIYERIGYNLKGTDLQAAIGLAQTKRMEYFAQKRRQNFRVLYQFIQENDKDEVFILPESLLESEPVWFGFPLTMRENTKSAKDVVSYLETNGISTRRIFGGNLVRHPAYCHINYVRGSLKNADKIMRDSFWIGIYPAITLDMIKHSAETVIKSIYG